MCFSFTPCYFAIIHIKYHIEMSRWRHMHSLECLLYFYLRSYWQIIIRPSSDRTYYGMVTSVPVSVRPALSPSVWVSFHQFSTLFSYMLWHIELKFCIWPFFNILQSKFQCHQFLSIFIRPSSDGTYYGMVMSVRPSVHPSVRPSVTVFRTFLLHALRYWAEILYITLLWCT